VISEGQDPGEGPGDYAAEIAAWVAERDRRLRDPNGWLALVGLHWLSDGAQTFGADPSNAIHLVGRGVPERGGTLGLTDGVVTLHPEPGSGPAVDGAPLDGDLVLADDIGQPPTRVDIGALRVHVIRRGERIGLRVRDTEAAVLESFTGVPRFAVDPAWRVTGHLERPPGLRTVDVPDVLGEVRAEESSGVVHFELGGEHLHLDALPEDDDMLWLIFGDTTNGTETYSGGRFLVTGPVAEDGSVVVDFNLAYNPPCVFSPYATCPLPWDANRLPIAVQAGERLPHVPGRPAD
jgi:hypothetical protein